MITKKDLKGMPVKEMIKCEGCGGYHSLEDSEVVIIRIVKGKECSIESTKTVPVLKDLPVKRELVELPDARVVKGIVDSDFVEDAPGEGRHIPPKEREAEIKTRKNIIPPGFASMMIPDGDPNFETKGAKEIRRY